MRAFGDPLKRDKRNFEVAADAQDFEHIHHFAVGHGAVGAQKNAPILAVVRGMSSSARDQVLPFHRRLADAPGEIALMVT